ncbi:universal stress protein [Actinomadura gamaensis]|uniref:Universal stress protein n=1 Tax=Actinomadura gamaensis TaxID=1763541 RepID=A0ABV9TSP6_9ACTN
MPDDRPVTVGVDASPAAEQALAWAAADAELQGRTLHVVHAVENWPFDIPLQPPPGFTESLRQSGAEVLAKAERLARTRAKTVDVTTELVAETPARALCDRSARAREIVVGSRGLGGFTGLVLGSVSLRVAERSTAPVVVVRESGAPGRAEGEIVAGLGLADDDAVLEYAFRQARAHGARLRVLHAWSVPDGRADALRRAEDDERLRWAQVRAHAPWRKRFADVAVTEEVARRHPVAALVDAAAGADLLVVGRRRRPGPVWRGLGSVSHGVLHHARCPVAVVPQPR